jgi:D-alanine-D-alanine ligase
MIEYPTNSQSPFIKSRIKTVVLAGGIGEERDISIQSGNCVAEALKQAGFNVELADITPEDTAVLNDDSIDVFFPALHGKFGEDGQLQQILEERSLIYTGSGPKASKLAFDKIASKEVFNKAGISTPSALEFNNDTNIEQLAEQLESFAGKYVVKPIKHGSSVGISIVRGIDKAIAAAQNTLSKFGDCMIEEFISGREITVGVFCGRAFAIIEIRTQNGFYDYHAKYNDERTQYLFDTIDNPQLTAKIQQAALDCFDCLGCRHFARVDFILSDKQIPYVLEVNTIPGFTSHSLLPKAATKAGLSMSDLCTVIVEAALEEKYPTEALVNQAVNK